MICRELQNYSLETVVEFIFRLEKK